MNELVNLAEAEMLKHEQVSCPVVHRFGPGIYIREVHIPAGTMAIGHAQRFEHTNVMLKGRVRILNDDGSKTELVAPLFFVGKPGRKIGYVIEDMVWQNIYATNETDIDKLEATYLDKSPVYLEHEEQLLSLQYATKQEDRDDYKLMLEESGFTHEVARMQSENESDQIGMPTEGFNVRVLPSHIEGKGVFLTYPANEGDLIAPARIFGKRTPAGRYTNHSKTPNAKMVMKPNGDIDLVALRRIEGCKGGDCGEEVTIDYRQALALSGIKTIKESACQV